MQTYPSKLQFIIISNIPVVARYITLQIDEDIVLKPNTQVKVFGVTLDNKPAFNQHVSVTRIEFARQ